MSKATLAFNQSQTVFDKAICDVLMKEINRGLPEAESKIWHAHPVWFLDGNPTVGYSKLKAGIRLMFWSGADFEEEALTPGTGKFKDASIIYTNKKIDTKALQRWLTKAKTIQWDYRNIQTRQGKLERIR